MRSHPLNTSVYHALVYQWPWKALDKCIHEIEIIFLSRMLNLQRKREKTEQEGTEGTSGCNYSGKTLLPGHLEPIPTL